MWRHTIHTLTTHLLFAQSAHLFLRWKPSVYISLCIYNPSHCKQLDWVPEWARWIQDSLLQTHWRPDTAPCRLSAQSERLTLWSCPQQKCRHHMLGVILTVVRRTLSLDRNVFLTSKKYFSVTMPDKALHKGLALWFIIFFDERIAWKH